jgi:hypothetical protein
MFTFPCIQGPKDPAFVERIVQDDILLWWRSLLPAVLAPVQARQAPTINP